MDPPKASPSVPRSQITARSLTYSKEPGNLTEIEIFTTGYIPCQEQVDILS
uniref:Uncharacterized protein n=1 Tax=Trichinella nativa TaxID=6335 RepID=A0A0V1KJ61_9BILA